VYPNDLFIVKIGNKLVVKTENNRIIMKNPNHVPNPSGTLWKLFDKSIDIGAVKLVEQSWDENISSKNRHANVPHTI